MMKICLIEKFFVCDSEILTRCDYAVCFVLLKSYLPYMVKICFIEKFTWYILWKFADWNIFVCNWVYKKWCVNTLSVSMLLSVWVKYYRIFGSQ